MDEQEKHRFVRQFVEQQKAYIPLYAKQGPPQDPHIGEAPSKSKLAIQNDGFGFDTPILRPRVSKAMDPPATPSPSSRMQERRVDPPHPKSPPGSKKLASLKPALTEVNEKRNKSTSPKHTSPDSKDTNDERAARLADRRERKRKKRAIVNTPKHNESTTTKTKGQKAKKPAGPAALALMYGFSATNVTKDRLTVKPAPSLGVFSKGRASSKTKTSAKKKSTSTKEMFSESAFLNKSSVESRNNSSDSSLSSVSGRRPPKKRRITKEKQTPLKKCKETPIFETPEDSDCAPPGSEIWDIELQSSLPSSVPEVRSEHGAKGSASIVLDLQGAKWSASVEAPEGHSHQAPTTQEKSKGPSIIGQSFALARSQPGDNCRSITRDADASTILPCHSASQVGRFVADSLPPSPRLITSKYFTAPAPIQQEDVIINVGPPGIPSSSDVPDCIQDQHTSIVPHLPQVSNNGLDGPRRLIAEQHIEAPTLDARTSHGADSPFNSLVSFPLPTLAIRTPYDSVAPLEFSSDDPTYHGQYLDAPQEPQVRPSYPDDGPEVRVASSSEALESYGPLLEENGSFRPLTTSYVSADSALEYLPLEVWEDAYHTIEPRYVYEQEEIFEDNVECQYDARRPLLFQPQNEDDHEESYLSGRGFPINQGSDDVTGYEREIIDASIYSHSTTEVDESVDESEDGAEVPDFLEGRALLLGISDQRHQIPRSVRLSGLHQAEMDVASRLRDHWRPLRL